MRFLLKHDYSKSQPQRPPAQFGADNAGIIIEGDSAKEAIQLWNAAQLHGAQINPFYLKCEELPA